MMKLRRTLTELLLEVTNEELASIGKEVYLNFKGLLTRLDLLNKHNSWIFS